MQDDPSGNNPHSDPTTALQTEVVPETKIILPREIQTLLDNQARDLELKNKELERFSKQDDQNFELAKLAIAARSQESVHSRAHKRWSRQWNTYAWGFAVLLLAVLFLVLMGMGEKEVAIQIAVLIGSNIAAGFGGYHAGKSKERKEAETRDEDQ